MSARPLLPSLCLWLDETPRDGASNMAFDEAMLRAATTPWMRVYSWLEPSVSIGFSQPLSILTTVQSELPIVRRWTGGGVVVHDGDWTYTLALPLDCEWCKVYAGETYRWVHEAMIAGLEASGLTGAELQPQSVSDGMGVCFVEPAKFDIVWQGNKIAGAAQRRNKAGLLHQGSVQGISIPAGFAETFARLLSNVVTVEDQTRTESLLRDAAHKLDVEKYGAPSWLHDRSVRS
jgi:lipoate-protein ligase A